MSTSTAMPFCSRVARATGFHPIGTAPTYRTHLAVECDVPWAREVSDSATFPAELRDLLARAATDGIEPRLTGLMPDPEYTREGLTRVLFYAHTDDLSPTYSKREFLVPPAQLAALVEALLFSPGHLRGFEAFEQETGHIRELLVCNHGSRDRCCATFGFEIYRELREVFARALPDALRVWRCSHLGGHRMAPTLLDFPEGRYYAYMTLDALPNLIGREGSFSLLNSQYRGWGRLSPLEQAAEHAVMLAEDWPWTTYRVRSESLPGNGGDGAGTVRFTYTSPDASHAGIYEVAVREAPEESLRFPSSCGKEVEPQPQFAVERVDKLP